MTTASAIERGIASGASRRTLSHARRRWATSSALTASRGGGEGAPWRRDHMVRVSSLREVCGTVWVEVDERHEPEPPLDDQSTCLRH
jgi:hypothetical protein